MRANSNGDVFGDAAGRLTAEATGRTVRHTYDAVGRPVRRTTPTGATTSCAYDAAGNRTGHSHRACPQLPHDLAGQELLRTLDDGTQTLTLRQKTRLSRKPDA
ncbi:RHS repeat domain-containing protein [Streptomyces venezuelae]|uniref:RHS repeat domain-containing protein n=1 Tax=Streptomyces venezuelae TaxID=54571 RepID=UPI001CC25CF5|nr:RHS repeat domain-containing protein [Streptomyces venezuelae]